MKVHFTWLNMVLEFLVINYMFPYIIYLFVGLFCLFFLKIGI